jgi:hypothetical protein
MAEDLDDHRRTFDACVYERAGRVAAIKKTQNAGDLPWRFALVRPAGRRPGGERPLQARSWELLAGRQGVSIARWNLKEAAGKALDRRTGSA